jgi:hypothetical protein
VDEHFARLAVNKGNPAVLARYLRHHPRDIIILAIADMIDPSGKSTIKLVPKHRRGKGRPPKRKIRKHIESAIAEVRVAEKMGGKPIGTRGYTKRAVGEVKEETEQSERTIKRLIALRNK